MKANLLLMLCASLLLSCISNKNIIIGNIDGLERGDKVFLVVDTIDEAYVVVDSVIVETDGSFYIETSATDTYAHLFMVKKDHKLDLEGRKASLFIEGFSTMNVDGNIDELLYAKIIGGLYSMTDMEKYNQIVASGQLVQKIFDDKRQSFIALRRQSQKEKSVSEDSLAKMYQEYIESRDQARRAKDREYHLNVFFRDNNPDAAYSAFVLNNDVVALRNGLEYYETLYNILTPRVKSTLHGRVIENKISVLTATAIGAMTPAFKAKDVFGNDMCLSDFRGKYLLIEFWGIGCGGCEKAIPHLVNMYDKIKGDKFELLSVAVDERSEDKLLDFIVGNKMVWRNINDSKGKIKEMYGIRAIPFCFLIDPEGKIIEKGHPVTLIPTIEKIILGE